MLPHGEGDLLAAQVRLLLRRETERGSDRAQLRQRGALEHVVTELHSHIVQLALKLEETVALLTQLELVGALVDQAGY